MAPALMAHPVCLWRRYLVRIQTWVEVSSPDGSSSLSVAEVPGSNPDLGGCLVSSLDGSFGLSVAKVPGSNPDLGGCLVSSPDDSSGLTVAEVPGSNPDLGECLVSGPDGCSGLTVAEVPGSNPDLTEVDVWYWLCIYISVQILKCCHFNINYAKKLK